MVVMMSAALWALPMVKVAMSVVDPVPMVAGPDAPMVNSESKMECLAGAIMVY